MEGAAALEILFTPFWTAAKSLIFYCLGLLSRRRKKDGEKLDFSECKMRCHGHEAC